MSQFEVYPAEQFVVFSDESHAQRLTKASVGAERTFIRKTVDNFLPLTDFIERALQHPFSPKDSGSLHIGTSELAKLREAAEAYQAQFMTTSGNTVVVRYPERANDDLRVAIPGLRRVIGSDRTIGQVSMNISENSIREVKRALLFCETILIECPVFPTSDEPSWLQFTRDQVRHYMDISDLIRRKIVIPFPLQYDLQIDYSNPWRKFSGTLNLSPRDEATIRDIARSLNAQHDDIALKDGKIAVINALIEQQRSHDSGSAFDPYVRNVTIAKAYTEMMRTLRHPYTDRQKSEPVNLAYLSTNFAIDPDKVNVKDIISIRESEPVFDTWQRVVRSCLNHLRNVNDVGLDREAELQEFASEHAKEWRSKVENVIGRGYMAHIIDTSSEATWSLATGTITGQLMGTKDGLVIAGLTLTARHLLRLMGGLTYQTFAARGGRRVRVAVDNHLLAIGAK